MAEHAIEPIDFDDVLPYLGEFGRYQWRLFFAMALYCFNIVFLYFPHIFVTLEPKHWCMVPKLQNLTPEERRLFSSPMSPTTGVFDGCRVYDIDFSSIIEDRQANLTVKPDPSWPTKECTSWEYDLSEVGGYPSIVSELDWVCERGNLAATAQSIFFVGAVVGGLLVGWLADRLGRIPLLVGTNVIGAISGLLTATSTSFTEYAIYKFIAGLAFDNIFVMMYVLALEYIAPQHRTIVANMSIAIFYTLATVLIPWFAILVSDWRLFSVLCSVPMMLGSFAYFFIPESVRWLMLHGRTDESIKIIKDIACINGKTVPENVLKQIEISINEVAMINSGKDDEELEDPSLLSLRKTPAQLRVFILVAFYWMLVSLAYDGHVRNVSNLPLDIFITFTIACATEFPADTLLTFTLDLWGRRWYAFGSMVLSGIFCLLVIAVPPERVFVVAGLAIMGRFCVNIAFNIGMQYAAEILPTVIRGQGVSAIHIAGYVAALVAPQIVLLGRTSPFVPLLVLGALSVLAGCLALLLPETLHANLPQTLEEGELFCKTYKFWSFPCITKPVEKEMPPSPSINVSPQDSSKRVRRRTLVRGESYRSSLLKRERQENVYLSNTPAQP